MTISTTVPPDQRTYALTAGISLILMALAAGFSYGFVHGSLVVPDDAGATWNNIASSRGLFSAGILGWFIILVCDIVVAWALYIFMRPIHSNLSLLAGWLRLMYSAILGIAILNLVNVLLLTNGSSHASLLAADQLQAHTMLFLESFEAMWNIGLILFGGHLLFIGILAFRSTVIPKFISVLLWIAAMGYMIIHFGVTFLPQYGNIISIVEAVLIAPMTVGELGLGLWLLFRGGKASAGTKEHQISANPPL